MTTERLEVIGDGDNRNAEQFYADFLAKLQQEQAFPSPYVYKFIVPGNGNQVAMIHAIFENAKASFATRDSKTGKYISLTVTLQADNAEQVVEYYKEVGSLQGVVML